MTKFDMRVNPCYQVDWQNSASGKRVSQTKRRVRWRFGFSHRESLEAGKTGPECRGEEHEVVLVWSLTSGKRLVIADGNEVHFSYGKRTDSKFDTSWTMAAGGHILKLVAYAAPPLFVTPGFKQFDLLLDGMSFFDMPKIYELGIRKANKLALATRVPQQSGDAYNNYSFAHPVTPGGGGRGHHDDYDYDSSEHYNDGERRTAPSRSPEPQPRRVIEPEPAVDFLSGDAADAGGVGQDYLLDDGPAAAGAAVVAADEFSPVEAPPPPPPAFQAVSNQILSHYAPPQQQQPAPAPMMALANESHTYGHPPPQTPVQQQQAYQPQQQQAYQPQQQQQTYYHNQQQQPTNTYYQQEQPTTPYAPPHQEAYGYQQQQPQVVTPQSSTHSAGSWSEEPTDNSNERDQPPSPPTTNAFQPSMQPLSIRELEEQENPMSEMEKAFKSLVNLDAIEESIETPEQIRIKEKRARNQPRRSRPVPPTAPEWHLGSRSTAKLGDIQQHAAPKAQPAREIMRTHAFDPAAVHAGMMVVHGSTTLQPPAAMGFGVGAAPAATAAYYAQQQYAQQQAQQQQYYQQQQAQQQYAQPVYTGY